MEKCVFFDLDGTLTDSGEGITKCVQLALRHFGIDRYAPEDLYEFVGPPLREMFPKYGVPADGVEEALSVYRSRYNTVGKYENRPYDGITELLARLRAAGNRLFVATSKPEALSVEILKHFGLAEYFERICGATPDGRIDTKESVIRYLLSQNDVAGETVMVGDTAYDVIGAAALGIPTVGVAWGFGSEEELRKAGAAAIARTPEELFRLLAEFSY